MIIYAYYWLFWGCGYANISYMWNVQSADLPLYALTTHQAAKDVLRAAGQDQQQRQHHKQKKPAPSGHVLQRFKTYAARANLQEDLPSMFWWALLSRGAIKGVCPWFSEYFQAGERHWIMPALLLLLHLSAHALITMTIACLLPWHNITVCSFPGCMHKTPTRCMHKTSFSK